MSIRSIMAMLIAAPILAVAGGGIVITPGSGWQVSRSAPAVPNWVDPNAANLLVYLSMNTNADGTIRDWSGNGNTATNTGATLVIVSTNKDQVQYAMDFDGADDYMNMSSAAITQCSNNFTISWCTAYDTKAEFEAFFSRTYPTVDNSPKSDWSASASNYRMYYFKDATHSDSITGPSATAFATGVWVHHTVTHTATTNIWYTNGVYCSGAEATGNQVSSGTITTQPLQIGRSGTGNWFDGKITEFRVYNIALSASDAATLAANSFPTSNNVVRTP